MHSRRHEDHMTKPTSSKLRNQTERSGLGNDPYQISHHDAPERAPRSLSPSKIDVSQRFLDGHRVSDSTDGRDYGFRLGRGRLEEGHSKSPEYRPLNKRDQFEDRVVHGNYGYPEEGDFDHGVNFRLKNVYGYDHSTSRANKERDYGENRVVDISSHGMLNQKSIPLEEDAISGLYYLPQDIEHTKNYVESGGNLPLSSRTLDVRGVESERLQYVKPIRPDKFAAVGSYKEEKREYHSRDRQPIRSDKLAGMESYKEERHRYYSRDQQPIPCDKLAAMESYKEEKHVYHSRDRQPIHSDKLAAMESYKEEKHAYQSKDKLPLMGSYRGEKPVYRSRNKLPMTESYREGEKRNYHSRDNLYAVPASHSKEILTTSQYKDFVSTSSVEPMSEFSVSYRDGVTLLASDEYLRNSVLPTEHNSYSSYGPGSRVNTTIDAEAEPRNFMYEQRGAYDSSRTEREDFVYPKTTLLVNDDRGYRSEDRHILSSPRIHAYDYAPTDYNLRDLPKPSNMLLDFERVDKSEHSLGDLRKSNVLDHPTLQKQTVSDYHDKSRKSNTLKHGGEYLNSASNWREFEREPQDYGVSQDHQISYIRSDYDYGRDAGQVHKYRSTSDHLDDEELQKISVRTHRIEEDHARDQSEKVLKRKNLDNDINRHNSRTIISRNWHVPEEFEDQYDSEECFDEGVNDVRFSKTRRFNQNEYRNGGRGYDGQKQYGNFESGDMFSTRDSLVHSQGSSIRYYKNSGKYVKANPRLGSLSRHNLHHVDKRTDLNKQHKVWKRIEDYDEDVHGNDGDTSEEWSHRAESEPSEDTEEFRELVQNAFLMYSKKLSVNPSARRRYKEQGKAGSLFCIACGRSLSKEFMNTQSLVQHAFMSHKVGLRALHLGLQKAICVLMGWNSVVSHDMITWVPEVLRDAEAMAQKEDLIIWPPVVVIRNISMSNYNPKEQKVIPMERVEAFLRGKGFVGGKITVCLGRPADQSVMVVKFLGTFTGLGNAEKLHKYFIEHKLGKAEFLQSTSSSINIAEAEMQGDQLEEQLLYGYMGISEDLDSVDFNTKKYCCIKSKKDILDLANDPVKPEER